MGLSEDILGAIQVIIRGLVMEDGTELQFWGSSQVEVDDVWIDCV